jgi:xanthine dehydrogenase small subunit
LIRFILNNKLISTDKPPGMLLLDFVRYHEHLTGTKIGCREGDCGACTVLLGELKAGPGPSGEEKLRYRSVVSCLTALGNVHLKHVVTIEGINREEGLNPLQQAVCEEGGTQCGFCTPGFIVAMAGFCLGEAGPSYANAVAAVDGNICRCTGYKSIERALVRIVMLLQENKGIEFLPVYFKEIPQRLRALSFELDGLLREKRGTKFLGGGTDLYVQQHETMETMGEADIDFLFDREGLRGIVQEGNRCLIGGATTVTDLVESPVIQKAFPRMDQFAHFISSTPIRNIATLSGNFVNASPIGDLSVFFLALDAKLVLSDGGGSSRELPLREFFLGYKVLNKGPGEFIERISFEMPDARTFFHFEKVSKRTCLDIASVNTAMRIRMNGDRIEEAELSAGGVGPIPAYLGETSAVLRGQLLEEGVILKAIGTARAEISPISDARGTAEYKRLLLGQLIKAHFLTLFPGLG